MEESLRYDTPVQFIGRMARESFTYRGHRIEAGQVVLPYVGSANRDPAHFAEPDRFDILRKPNRHVALGQGPHMCIGANLVRIQTQLALQALLTRMPDLRVAPLPDKVWNTNLGFRGLQSLTVQTYH